MARKKSNKVKKVWKRLSKKIVDPKYNKIGDKYSKKILHYFHLARDPYIKKIPYSYVEGHSLYNVHRILYKHKEKYNEINDELLKELKNYIPEMKLLLKKKYKLKDYCDLPFNCDLKNLIELVEGLK